MDTRRVIRSWKPPSVETTDQKDGEHDQEMTTVSSLNKVKPEAELTTKHDMGLRIKPNKKQAQNSAAYRSPFKCSVCDKKFTSNGNLLRHKRLHTSRKTFTRSSKLKILEKVHKQSRFPCRYCKDRFPTMELRRTHTEQVHSQPKKTKRTKNVGSRRKYSCGCNMANPANLNRDKFIHTGEMPSQCEICIKFRRMDGLHVKNPYKCKVCGRCYNTSFGLVRHMNQVHPTVNTPPYVNQISEPKNKYPQQRQTEKRVKIAINAAIRHVFNPRSSEVPLRRKSLPQKDTVSRNSNKSHSQRRRVMKKKIVRKKNRSSLLPNPLPKTASVKEMERDEMKGGDAPLRKPPIEQRRSSPPIQLQLTHPPKKQMELRKCAVCSKEVETDHNLIVHTLVFHPAKGYGLVCGICQKPFPSLHLLSSHYEYIHSDDKNAAEEAKILLSSSNSASTSANEGAALDVSSSEQDEEKMKEAMDWPLVLKRLRSSDAYTVFYNNNVA